MADPSKDRVWLANGKTAQQTVDDWQKPSGQPHPSATDAAPKQFVGPKIQPNAPGGKSYGAPIQAPIVK